MYKRMRGRKIWGMTMGLRGLFLSKSEKFSQVQTLIAERLNLAAHQICLRESPGAETTGGAYLRPVKIHTIHIHLPFPDDPKKMAEAYQDALRLQAEAQAIIHEIYGHRRGRFCPPLASCAFGLPPQAVSVHSATENSQGQAVPAGVSPIPA